MVIKPFNSIQPQPLKSENIKATTTQFGRQIVGLERVSLKSATSADDVI